MWPQLYTSQSMSVHASMLRGQARETMILVQRLRSINSNQNRSTATYVHHVAASRLRTRELSWITTLSICLRLPVPDIVYTKYRYVIVADMELLEPGHYR